MPTSDGSPARRLDPKALLPSPTLPIVWLAGAHLAFAAACVLLVLDPALPGGFHYHPRLIAVVHLVTLGWITGSILGALYVVAPLAFGVPLRAGVADAVGAVAFWTGAGAMVCGFWTGRYVLVACGAPLVLATLALVGARVVAGLWRSRVPWGGSLHVTQAFANILAAGGAGLWLAHARTAGLAIAPLPAAVAHGHLAVVGWAVMMIVGVSYRLIPMFLPAAMPSGAHLGVSALLLEAGVAALGVGLLRGTSVLPGALLLIGGFASFFATVRGMLGSRRPRPVELPRPDWSTWQTHVALLSLVIAATVGLWIASSGATPARAWVYGVVGLIGFASQMVAGIEGRLLPLHAWYRGMQRRGAVPEISVHRLADPRLARAVLLGWLAGLPLLTAGLAFTVAPLIAAGALALLAATILNAWLGFRILREPLRVDAAPGAGEPH
jgi:hypothetical protein